ncbi:MULTISPECIES: hypothetical protein [Virgibacillus]|uniref:hypothetical protein n=1 Tax=Virgibacillus TaxID=84406 RepID=UPI00090A8FCE|nr:MULTISPECIES: hypothetical protein [Virgibacillus]API90998.1 hypothetical protein BKP57_03495 [Virgibacillus sp. 6R]MBS7428983.1 hypothetical protein [Virgibacillus sp. 19R1-5]MBU8566736.1 hypothetical protein [Virgibacillus pantothenticus]MBU8600319.1 hypothetical protein [Virgibacillus pantothenticus]MBU8634892.1 hypothetical protein [Virgibacillus pantothenticus]
MGYILPIKQYQYQQYHQRMNTKQQDTIPVHRPFKSVLDKRHQQLSKQYERFHTAGYDRYVLSQQDVLDASKFYGMYRKGERFSKEI